MLPDTAANSAIARDRYPHVNAVAGITLTQTAGELDVAVHLTGAAAVTTSATGSSIVLDVGAPAAREQQAQSIAPPPAASSEAGRTYEVVPLKYADVSEVVGVLVSGTQIPPNDSFQPEGSIFTLPTSVNGAPSVAQTAFNVPAPQQPQSYGQRIDDNIAIDRRLNAVILSGTPAEVAALKAAIAQIDVPLPSVMLECEVVELSETAAKDLGLQLASGQNAPIVIGSASTQTGTPDTRGGLLLSAGLTAQLFATIAHGGGRILATPRVLALNGTPAQILSGDALPLIQTTIFPGNPPTTQITTSYIAVGVNLQIQPRITEDGFVTSHIFAEVSSVTAFVPTSQGPVPQISLRQSSTSATVADGTPFVIGGLLRDEEITNMSKIPILGDLPIIGGLFRVRHDTLTHTNLFIFITPHIVRPHAQTNAVTPPAALPTPRVPGPTPQPR